MLPQKGIPQTLEEWAGYQHLSLTLVFTDIVESTRIGSALGDAKWIDDLFKHFSQARSLAAPYDCYLVKVIGDAVMMAFRTPTDAMNFALAFATETGVDYIGIRIGIHSGQVQIRENDVYGLNVNFASRVQGESVSEGILVSNSVKEDYERASGWDSGIHFSTVDNHSLERFWDEQVLWRVVTQALYQAAIAQQKARSNVVVDYW